MNRPLLSPIGPFESLWQTTLNPPANHSHVSVQVVLPPGPHGPGFISPEPFHLPINTPRRFCSAPGFGGPAGACACAATALMNKVTSNPTKIRFAIFTSLEPEFPVSTSSWRKTIREPPLSVQPQKGCLSANENGTGRTAGLVVLVRLR